MDNKIAIIGLGYVGLPLAIEFGKVFETIGFDVNELRIKELLTGKDSTLETTPTELKEAQLLSFTSDPEGIQNSNIFIITVPTPIDEYKKPDLRPLENASETIAKFLKKDDIVIYESTVYPGATEEICVPILEQFSGLEFNKDFFCGYSPERINPGDKTHRLTMIKKVTSGSTQETAEKVDNLYKKIINAGTHRAESIKIAEAAKVIENTQRDVNIALINELAVIFNKLGIDTQSVLDAAGTKWNFIPFVPGLVGGHCIGVDPYYLAHLARENDVEPKVILSARETNDHMASHCAELIQSKLLANKTSTAKILIMGATFKENCPDTRNTKVFDLVESLQSHGVQVDCYDPWIQPKTNQLQSNISMIDEPKLNYYDGIIVTVAHDEFKEIGIDTIRGWGSNKHILFDLKYIFKAENVDLRL